MNSETPKELQLNIDAGILTKEEQEIAKKLSSDGQSHLFEGWDAPGINDQNKHSFFSQISQLSSSYPGGLEAYIRNARKLLAGSRDGIPMFEGLSAVPADKQTGIHIDFQNDSSNLTSLEFLGLKEIRHCAFVLVAGGIGERLGYSGIKIALESDSLTSECYLSKYISAISDLDQASLDLSNKGPGAQLAIMTSEDTHERTLKLLDHLSYGKLGQSRITLIMQGKVPCVFDNSARLARMQNDKYTLETKPHGHGDVHALLHSSGLLEKWLKMDIHYVILFQDTNSLFFRTVPSLIGVSVRNCLDVNFTCVPRAPGEAIGGLAQLIEKSTGKVILPLCNVEYNQLAPLIPCGKEIPDTITGQSPYPGNINEIVLYLKSYSKTLSRTLGLTPEFINPKYVPGTNRAKLSSTARLECMMQDYPRGLMESDNAKLGFTEFDIWVAFSPAKNALSQGKANFEKGIPPATMATSELDIYRSNSKILSFVGAIIENGGNNFETFFGVKHEIWPLIVYPHSWAPTLSVLSSHIGKEGKVTISRRSALIIEGYCNNVDIKSLDLDGTLIIRVEVPGVNVIIDGLTVKNASWKLRELTQDEIIDRKIPESIRIRGFIVEKHDQRVLSFTKKGDFIIDH